MLKTNISGLLSVAFFLGGCQSTAEEEVSTSKFDITAMTGDIKAALSHFYQQERRLEFNGCTVAYNGKTFGVDTTIGELVALFGEYGLHRNGIYIWHDFGMTAYAGNEKKEGLNANLLALELRLNTTISREIGESDYRDPGSEDYVLFEGFPINYSTPFNQWIEATSLTVQDFNVGNYGYGYRYQCDGTTLEYFISASDTWEYEGGGHLQYKSNPNLNNESPITEIFFRKVIDEK